MGKNEYHKLQKHLQMIHMSTSPEKYENKKNNFKNMKHFRINTQYFFCVVRIIKKTEKIPNCVYVVFYGAFLVSYASNQFLLIQFKVFTNCFQFKTDIY